MPIFIKHKKVFIHIPKTAGSSIEKQFELNNDKRIFHSESVYINGHSPQHSTFKELLNWRLIPNDFQVFAVIRHPYERFVSEYNYRNTKNNPENLDSFCNRLLGLFRNEYDWDNHHLSSSDFIEGANDITLLRFESLKEDFKNFTGIELKENEMKREKIITLQDLSDEIKNKIQLVWSKDFEYFK